MFIAAVVALIVAARQTVFGTRADSDQVRDQLNSVKSALQTTNSALSDTRDRVERAEESAARSLAQHKRLAAQLAWGYMAYERGSPETAVAFFAAAVRTAPHPGIVRAVVAHAIRELSGDSKPMVKRARVARALDLLEEADSEAVARDIDAGQRLISLCRTKLDEPDAALERRARAVAWRRRRRIA